MIKPIIFSSVTAVAICILAFNSCKHDPIPPKVPTEEICFQNDVLPVIESNCAKSGCHDNSGRGGLKLTDYDNIVKQVVPGDGSNSKLYTVIIRNSMPPSSSAQLTTDQEALIYGWIAQGAKNSTCASGCDTNLFTFSGAVWPTIHQNCTGCHSGANPGAGISLQNWADVVASVDNDDLYGAIINTSSPMPQSGLMEACKIRQIKKWIDAGKLNN